MPRRSSGRPGIAGLLSLFLEQSSTGSSSRRLRLTFSIGYGFGGHIFRFASTSAGTSHELPSGSLRWAGVHLKQKNAATRSYSPPIVLSHLMENSVSYGRRRHLEQHQVAEIQLAARPGPGSAGAGHHHALLDEQVDLAAAQVEDLRRLPNGDAEETRQHPGSQRPGDVAGDVVRIHGQNRS